MRTAIWLTCACLTLATPASAQDKETMQKLADVFAAAFNRGDYATVAGMYTSDAYLLPPGVEMMRGHDAILAFWIKAGQQIGDVKLTTVDVAPLGNGGAREIGAFTLKTKGAQPTDVAGKFVVYWTKVGGDWKLATDIWNTNK